MFNRLATQMVRQTSVFRAPTFNMIQQPQQSFLMTKPTQFMVPIQQPTFMPPSAMNFARFMATARTYQPSVKRRKSKHGFLKRLSTLGGRKVITARRKKGRWQIGM